MPCTIKSVLAFKRKVHELYKTKGLHEACDSGVCMIFDNDLSFDHPNVWFIFKQ